MQKLFLAPFLAALPFLAAATSEKPAAPEANAAFRTFVDDYFAARFARLPSDATSAGIHDHDGTLEDYSRTAVLARVAALRDSLERLAALQARPLGFDEAIDAAAIEGQIRGELLDLDTIRELERNPMPYAGLAGNAVDVLMKRDFAPAAERLRSVVSRLEAVPGVYAAARANLRNPPREFTDLAIRVTKGSVGFFEDDVAAWARGAAGADTALLAEFESANATAVRETTAFAEWLERDVLPRSKGRYAIGRDNFAAKLRYDEQVEAPLAEVLARGEAQLAKDYQAFGETARRIDPAR
ncbi:MAG TPA: DUF885 family protein, partial [Vicinamibacteria bacterium]